MRSNSKGFAQIIVVVLLLILVGGAAYYFRGQKGKVPFSVSPTPKPTEALTTNWKTYINKTNKYSLKLPDYISQHPGCGSCGDDQRINDNYWVFGGANLNPSDRFSTDGISLSIIVHKDNNANRSCPNASETDSRQANKVISVTPIVEDVEQYIQSSGNITLFGKPDKEYWDSEVCFIKNGIGYEFSYQNFNSKSPDTTFDQILSTFEFTN